MTGVTTSEALSPGLLMVAERARRDPQERIRGLCRFVDVAALARAYDRLRKDAAVGVDGMTVEQYGQRVEENLVELHAKLKAGQYRHQPIQKLAPLIPPPRFHLLRFHGVFAPNAKLRSRVVPQPAPKAEAATTTAKADRQKGRPTTSPYRLDWAAALKRVFGVDVLQCARCGGRLVILAFIEKRTAVRAILAHLGLPAAPLPLEKARGPPQAAWDF